MFATEFCYFRFLALFGDVSFFLSLITGNPPDVAAPGHVHVLKTFQNRPKRVYDRDLEHCMVCT